MLIKLSLVGLLFCMFCQWKEQLMRGSRNFDVSPWVMSKCSPFVSRSIMISKRSSWPAGWFLAVRRFHGRSQTHLQGHRYVEESDSDGFLRPNSARSSASIVGRDNPYDLTMFDLHYLMSIWSKRFFECSPMCMEATPVLFVHPGLNWKHALLLHNRAHPGDSVHRLSIVFGDSNFLTSTSSHPPSDRFTASNDPATFAFGSFSSFRGLGLLNGTCRVWCTHRSGGRPIKFLTCICFSRRDTHNYRDKPREWI